MSSLPQIPQYFVRVSLPSRQNASSSLAFQSKQLPFIQGATRLFSHSSSLSLFLSPLNQFLTKLRPQASFCISDGQCSGEQSGRRAVGWVDCSWALRPSVCHSASTPEKMTCCLADDVAVPYSLTQSMIVWSCADLWHADTPYLFSMIQDIGVLLSIGMVSGSQGCKCHDNSQVSAAQGHIRHSLKEVRVRN